MIDFLARLDGIDFRQTAPVRPGSPYIRPYGAEWQASEEALTRPVAGINPTMITRAGALDQGNLILNLQDLEAKGIAQNVLFLAGSAINTIKDKDGKPDPRIGLEAMLQAIEVHRSGELKDTPDGRASRCAGGPGRAQEPDRTARGAAAALSGENRMIAKDERCLRIGILGCGPIAQFAHMDACRKAKNAELYAICDLADDLRRAHGDVCISPRSLMRDYDAMLADPQVEAVLIAIADQFHVPAALEGDRGRQACAGRETAGDGGRALPRAARPGGRGQVGCPGRQQPPVRPGHRLRARVHRG